MKIHRALPPSLQSFLKDGYDVLRARRRERSAWEALVKAAARLSSCCLDEPENRTSWEQRKGELKKRLAWMLGLSPLPCRAPLKPLVTGTVERGNYRIEKVVFESLPGLLVTGNFYLPKGDGPFPCVLYLCGHWPSLQGAKTGFQDRYLWYPSNGFALLVVDPLQFGEAPGIHFGTSRLNLWEWLSLGYTPAGVEVWNAMRAVDWLETRPEVHARRLGVTGISGGGVITHYLAALDERVAAAVPSCSTYTIGTQAAMGLVPEQCDCTFLPNVYGIDLPAVDALIAPRPLLILGGRKDPVFPAAGFREAFRRAKRVYDLYPTDNRGDRIRLVESSEAHTDPPAFLREARAWMMRWLGEPERAFSTGSRSPKPEDPRMLTCLERRPPKALNYSVHRTWIRRAVPSIPQSPDEWRRRREELLTVLHERIFSWLPPAKTAYRTRPVVHSGGYAGHLARFREVELETEPSVWVQVQYLEPRHVDQDTPLIIRVRGAGEYVRFPDVDEFLPLVPSFRVLSIMPRFAEAPALGRAYAHAERTAAMIGRTLAAMSVIDVVCAARWARSHANHVGAPTVIYGRGCSGIIGMYAAILEEGIGGVILGDPPLSHREGPALLTIMRETDLCETAALLAPRPLAFLGERPAAFHWTRDAYALQAAEDAISSHPSLAEAVFVLLREKVQFSN